MIPGKHFFVSILAFILLCSMADSQIMANRLCFHNGGEYYVSAYDHGSPNDAVGRYFPSYTHRAALGVGEPGNWTWPWKIRGWSFTGMMAFAYGPTWYWETLLQKSKDNPWSASMTWNYPVNFALGIVPHEGWPVPIYFGYLNIAQLPSYVQGQQFFFPSSSNGFDQYLNIFALTNATWHIPSTIPFYGFDFGLMVNPSAAFLVPSDHSIWEYIYESQGPFLQYCVLSGNELDCLGGGGNKGMSYSIALQGDTAYTVYYRNKCTGTSAEWAMCLFVEDAVSIPVNDPGVTNWPNPFRAYGFDAGIAAITPLYSSEVRRLRIMTEDYAHAGGGRVLLAGSPWKDLIPFGTTAKCLPYGPAGYRLPHAWDVITDFFSSFASLWYHETNPGYPSGVFGTTTGGHSQGIIMRPYPAVIGLEIFISTFSANGHAPSAAFMMVPY
jgi:hypothetical protein